MQQLNQIANYLDAIQLKEKSVEPETRETNFLTRNLQLGNIEKREFFFHSHRTDKALELKSIPKEYGGWLTEEIGKRNIRKIETQMVLSGSVDGFVRRMNQTTISDQTITDKSKKPFFSSLFGGSQ